MNDAKHVLFTAFEKVRYTVDPEFDPRLLASKQCGETIKIPLWNKDGQREVMSGCITNIFSGDVWTCAHVEVSQMITDDWIADFGGNICLQCEINLNKKRLRGNIAEFFLKAPPFIPNPR